MINKETVESLVNEWLEGKVYFLVEVSITPDKRIVVEIDDAEGVWIEDCVALSKYLESELPDLGDYELEVGSAGIGQPFKIPRQYICHIGHDVEVLTADGKKLTGCLKDADEEGFIITIQKKVRPEGAKRPKMVEEDLRFGYEQVKYTKYLISFK